MSKKLANKYSEKPTKIPKKESINHDKVPLRFGPLPVVPHLHVLSRGILIAGVLIYLWVSSQKGKEISFAKQPESLPIRGQTVECDEEYLKEINKFPGCVPKKCGRFVTDSLITTTEVSTLLSIAKKAFEVGRSSGGASIFDLHSGALSHGEKFINVYAIDRDLEITSKNELLAYKTIRSKIQHAIAENFGIDENDLFLTYPSFFSKLTKREPKTAHDEYWHIHVDKETYKSFHYTSLLYLTDYDVDFKGGRFIFVDDVAYPLKNTTIEPKKGRVLMFTSGAENPHFVERVNSGERLAITVSFTCNETLLVTDPQT